MVRASWGVPDAGGTMPASVAATLEEKPVTKVVGALYAFAALLTDGTVQAWGWTSGGGEVVAATQDALVNIVDITATHSAFAARTSSGTIVAWGDPVSGGSQEAAEAALGGARADKVIGNNQAFAAITLGGFVVAWGIGIYGGDTSDVNQRLQAIV